MSQNTQLPSEMTIGGCTYEILNFLKGDEKCVDGRTMLMRAKKMNAHLGFEDGEHLMIHQDEIPVMLRDEVSFIFTAWKNRDRRRSNVTCVCWRGDYWDGGNVYTFEGYWTGDYRVLRRKSNPSSSQSDK